MFREKSKRVEMRVLIKKWQDKNVKDGAVWQTASLVQP